jgi:hypothetical protein
MELIFKKSQMRQSGSALTPEGIKITFVRRTKSPVIIYGQNLIAECRNKDEASKAVSEHMVITS